MMKYQLSKRKMYAIYFDAKKSCFARMNTGLLAVACVYATTFFIKEGEL